MLPKRVIDLDATMDNIVELISFLPNSKAPIRKFFNQEDEDRLWGNIMGRTTEKNGSESRNLKHKRVNLSIQLPEHMKQLVLHIRIPVVDFEERRDLVRDHIRVQEKKNFLAKNIKDGDSIKRCVENLSKLFQVDQLFIKRLLTEETLKFDKVIKRIKQMTHSQRIITT